MPAPPRKLAGMCLIGIAYKVHPACELVLSANRDEFHHRATAPASWWTDAPQVYGGRDLAQGGGWMALSRQRRMAAVTNVRRMVPPDPRAPSRGALVADFVRGTQGAAEFAQQLRAGATRYAGFNLLLWDGDVLLHVTNQLDFLVEPVPPGVHGLSNATLDTPWPKLTRLTAGLRGWQPEQGAPALFSMLADERPATDAELPDTGVGREMERFLSSPFIRGEGYGTRASSVLLIGAQSAQFHERRFGPEGLVLGESQAQVTFTG